MNGFTAPSVLLSDDGWRSGGTDSQDVARPCVLRKGGVGLRMKPVTYITSFRKLILTEPFSGYVELIPGVNITNNPHTKGAVVDVTVPCGYRRDRGGSFGGGIESGLWRV